MTKRTLNDYIKSVITGDSEPEELPVVESAPVAQPQVVVENDVEKLASILEFISSRGVATLLKTAAPASQAPAGTNAGANLKGSSGSQHMSTKNAPPMKSSKSGPTETNAAKKPAAGSGSVDTTGKATGTSHPALSSNEAAINASPTVKEKQVSSSLKAVLSNAGSGANHEKMKKTAGHNLDAIRTELARRAAAGGSHA
jgi:hypothetical protein